LTRAVALHQRQAAAIHKAWCAADLEGLEMAAKTCVPNRLRVRGGSCDSVPASLTTGPSSELDPLEPAPTIVFSDSCRDWVALASELELVRAAMAKCSGRPIEEKALNDRALEIERAMRAHDDGTAEATAAMSVLAELLARVAAREPDADTGDMTSTLDPAA
jgi:hypothetical protein